MIDIIGKGKRFLQRNKRRIVHAFQTMQAKRHIYVSLPSYVFECPNKARILSLRTEKLITTIGENTNQLQNGGQIVLYKTVIKNASCFVYSDIILLDDSRCIYRLKELDSLRLITDYEDEILLQDTNQWCKLRKCHRIEHIKKAIKIGGMFGFNYYHFMFQLLPKLFETHDIDKSIPILLDRKAADVESMRQIVEWCNAENRDIIYMDYDIEYRVGELYLVESPNICIPNVLKGNVYHEPKAMFSEKSIYLLRKTLITHMDMDSIYPSKIFVCRKQATKQRSYNEEELYAIAKRYGFEAVFPEQLSINQQIALFNNAKYIIAPEGAALSNLIYASKGCSLLILYCIRSLSSEFEPIALSNGMKVFSMCDTPQGRRDNSAQRKYIINPTQFEITLRKFIEQ